MKTILRIGFVVVLLCLFALPVQAQLEKHEALATKLVNKCLNLKENDYLAIVGSTRDADLMHEVHLQSQKIGAEPFILLQSPYRARRYYDIVPEKYDTKFPWLNLQFSTFVTAQLGISTTEDLDLFKDVPPERFTVISENNKIVNDIFRRIGVKYVSLGNGLYPTESLAKQFRISKEELAKLFWDGINTNYNKLNEVGSAIKSTLKSGKKVQITDNLGTNIKMEITSQPVRLSDGFITDEEVKLGFPYTNEYLPAGEVFMPLVPGTANGKIVVNNKSYQGVDIENLTLEFKNGKLVSMSAKSGLEGYKERYDAAGEGKDELGSLDIGINPNIKFIPGSRMEAYMASGLVSLSMGNNAWAGGENTSDYSSVFFLPNANLKVDGKTIVKSGVLK